MNNVNNVNDETPPESGEAKPIAQWRAVWWLGVVSLLVDMIYEGARAYTAPYLTSLGASALLIGAVTGFGEGAALMLRFVFGPWADRTAAHWKFTIAGYGLTALSVPLLGLAPRVGAAGLGVAASLLIAERVGKAIRSPSKAVLLAEASRGVGRGKGFAVHKALDQVGAFSGPLLIAGLLAVGWRAGNIWWVFAIPGLLALGILVWLRSATALTFAPATRSETAAAEPLPRIFHAYAAACAACSFGLMTFGVLAVHMSAAGLVRNAAIPLVYAGAMAVQAFVALGAGFGFDRWGGRTLLVVPPLVALVPILGFGPTLGSVLAGLACWAMATAVMDSTVKALVAQLVDRSRLGSAYGQFAAWQGGAVLLGGLAGGWAYDHDHLRWLEAGVLVSCLCAGLGLNAIARHVAREVAGLGLNGIGVDGGR